VAEKIRTAVTCSTSILKRPITLSIGISILHGTDIEAEVIIQQADIALYEAKRRGRDQICVFKDGETIHNLNDE